MATNYNIYDHIPTPLQILDLEGNIKYVNKFWLDTIGYKKSKVLGKKFESFLSKKAKKNYTKKFLELLKQKEISNLLCEIVKKDKTILYASYNGKVEKNTIYCSFLDITEHIKQKKELEFKELYRTTIFNAEPDLLVATYGEKIDEGNLSMLEFTGYDTIKGFKKEHDCICELFIKEDGYIYKEIEGLNWLEYIYKYPKKFHKVKMEKKNKEYTFHIYAKRLYFDEKDRSIVIFNDITELIEYEQKLIKSEENLQKALKLSKIGYWEFDIKNHKGKWSKTLFDIFELNPNKDMISPDTYFEYIFPQDLEKAKVVLNNTIKNNDPYEVTYRIKTINNKLKYIYEEAELQLDENKNPSKLFGYAMDITEKTMMQEELEEKEEIMLIQSRHAAMGEMISMIAHQWRQPISVISMGANNMLADIELDCMDKNEFKEQAEDILTQTRELSKTIDDFRNFFKPGRNMENIDIKDIFDEVLQVMGKSLENNNIQLTINYNTSKSIYTYSRELMQVLINIIKNAKEVLVERDIERSNRKIDINISEIHNQLAIKICDNAGGIEIKNLKRVFDPYFSTKDEKTGTGLGLYMSKTIIEKHLKGTISAINGKEGACFAITLP